jgi:hypothetical protein
MLIIKEPEKKKQQFRTLRDLPCGTVFYFVDYNGITGPKLKMTNMWLSSNGHSHLAGWYLPLNGSNKFHVSCTPDNPEVREVDAELAVLE